ncbi:ATP-binding protein [Anaerobacillus isosaccharinicus]|uniref:histidine kinase n=1 Tax=Anaerobacillus isosaccharinicus TaxID=1532552 RepID=A0A7S7RAR2_9BACI|nr:ATP-binding protein [Anaerobacillus isosaccharinicus]MBA5586631.1 two-component sensor histidine kinase [Anaerobacillus isosaccharinicus]QOY35135.1 two-component sensor histidine kinase [Anaerobacillus isosaccharinicus]
MTETLLINFLILLLPVLIYLIFLENKISLTNKNFLLLLGAITTILCMSYPIRLELGFTFDLRYFPFIIASLYGGYKVGFPLYIVINVYRLMIGGPGVLQSFILSTVIFLLVPLLHKKFVSLSSPKKVGCAAMVALGIILVFISTLTMYYETLNHEYWIVSINAITIYVVCMTLIMILVEQIRQNLLKREKLIQAEQMNVINNLSASVSHEIRNPLTVTSGFLQLLNQSKTISGDDKRYVEWALKELNRAEKIVSDFLALGKPQSQNMVQSNFKEEAEYVKEIITPYANLHEVTVQLSFNNELTIEYDKNQVQQCLLNLYKNGIESMKDKGGTLSVDVSSQGHRILIKIEDNGVGMTKEDISRLGKPYYSTKVEGTGLGMFMVYNTITKLGGKIDVQSEQGKGTTFHIAIPV